MFARIPDGGCKQNNQKAPPEDLFHHHLINSTRHPDRRTFGTTPLLSSGAKRE